MCEASAYWADDEQEVLIMESVDILEPEGNDHWRLVGIFGDQKYIEGRIKSMSLVNHKIYFERRHT
jgi:predicted RNA-binding protein